MEQISLYILLIAALAAVAGLSVALYRCRRRLAQCQRAMVRCINENLDMKEKLPEHELPHFLNREEIIPEEFTRNHSRRIYPNHSQHAEADDALVHASSVPFLLFERRFQYPAPRPRRGKRLRGLSARRGGRRLHGGSGRATLQGQKP